MAGENDKAVEVKKKQRKPKLNTRELAFCQALFNDPEGTKYKAAITAGYSPKTAHAIASRLLKSVKVQECLDRLRSNAVARANKTTDELIKEQENIAFSDIADYLDFDGNGVKLKALSSIPRHQRAAIASVKQTAGKDGISIEFKLWDKNKALDMLNRIHKQYEGPVNPNGNTINNQNTVVFVLPKFQQADEKNAVNSPYKVVETKQLPKEIKLNGNGSNHNGTGK